jgi:hypothetical protein
MMRIFRLKNDEVTGVWRKPHNEELNDLYTTSYVIRVIKSKIMSWARDVARYGGTEIRAGFWWGNLRESDHMGDSGLDEKIILRRNFTKFGRGMDWIDLTHGVEKWQAFVYAVLKPGFNEMWGIS